MPWRDPSSLMRRGVESRRDAEGEVGEGCAFRVDRLAFRDAARERRPASESVDGEWMGAIFKDWEFVRSGRGIFVAAAFARFFRAGERRGLRKPPFCVGGNANVADRSGKSHGQYIGTRFHDGIAWRATTGLRGERRTSCACGLISSRPEPDSAFPPPLGNRAIAQRRPEVFCAIARFCALGGRAWDAGSAASLSWIRSFLDLSSAKRSIGPYPRPGRYRQIKRPSQDRSLGNKPGSLADFGRTCA